MKTFLIVLVLAFAMGGVTTQEQNTSEVPTTTVAPVTTTITPLPPKPQKGSWNVTDQTGQTCIMMEVGIRFTFNVTDTKTNKTSTIEYDVPDDPSSSESSGTCGTKDATKQTLNITFNADAWLLTFDFIKKDKQYYLENVMLKFKLTTKISPDIITDISGEAKLENQTLFKTQVDNSYQCISDQPFTFTSVSPDYVKLSMMTVDLQVQAFRTSDKPGFGTAQECSADAATDNIVPIAVGAALAALVVIVLIAYLISRNRNKRGYESV